MRHKQTKNTQGYMVTSVERTRKTLYVHRIIAENVLGRSLSSHNQVHHVNGDKSDNRHINLVICEDRKYHNLLHRRAEALKMCGHADWRKCYLCKKWSPTNEIYVSPSKYSTSYHNYCMNEYNKKLIKAKKCQQDYTSIP